VNLTQKYLPFICLCYQSPCALLLTGGICDRDDIVACILPRIYIFLELETMSFSKLAAAVIFAIFTKVCCVFLPFFAVIFYCPYWWASSKMSVLTQCVSSEIRSAGLKFESVLVALAVHQISLKYCHEHCELVPGLTQPYVLDLSLQHPSPVSHARTIIHSHI